jgi:tRNA1Val (adenine37-N6)-methyltransferase
MATPPVRPDETLDELFRGKLRVIQKRQGFRLSMDPILLASFASPLKKGRVIDLGTGSGVMPLIVALRGETDNLVGLEVDSETADMARRSVQLNGLEKRIEIVRGDIRDVPNLFPPQSYEHVICNPPYHAWGSGRESTHPERAAAKHELVGSLADVVQAARHLLGTKGRLWLIYSPVRLVHLIVTLHQAGIPPKNIRMVHGRAELPARLVLVEGVRGGREGLTVRPPLVLYIRDNVYTEELEEIYRMI